MCASRPPWGWRWVVEGLDPGPEPGVGLLQADAGAEVDLAEELIPEGAMPALELTLALGGRGAAVDKLYTEARTDRPQGVGTIGRAVVDHQLAG
jgi:hypothetical protein